MLIVRLESIKIKINFECEFYFGVILDEEKIKSENLTNFKFNPD